MAESPHAIGGSTTGAASILARQTRERSPAITPEEPALQARVPAFPADFDDLYKQYAPMVHGIVLARVPYDEVGDIVQEVFLSAYKNLHTLRETNAVGGWLATIARNKANEFYRQKRPTEELPESLSGKRDLRHEAAEALTAIRSLPDTYRETLVLRLIEGMTGNEIAEKTGLTPDSVRVNLHRGMEQLRQKLGVNQMQKPARK
ncbi:sigma-70 family RNA polymerase sigma factor [soil metagenome]